MNMFSMKALIVDNITKLRKTHAYVVSNYCKRLLYVNIRRGEDWGKHH